LGIMNSINKSRIFSELTDDIEGPTTSLTLPFHFLFGKGSPGFGLGGQAPPCGFAGGARGGGLAGSWRCWWVCPVWLTGSGSSGDAHLPSGMEVCRARWLCCAVMLPVGSRVHPARPFLWLALVTCVFRTYVHVRADGEALPAQAYPR